MRRIIGLGLGLLVVMAALAVYGMLFPHSVVADAFLTITDGVHTVPGAQRLTVTGGTVGGAGNDATLTITGGGGGGGGAATWTGLQTFTAGISVPVTNGQVGNDPNDRRAVDVNCTTDSSTSNVGFTDENCLQIMLNASQGRNVYGNGTNSKTTFLPLLITGNMTAAGQRFLLGEQQNCWGMGDCFGETKRITYAGGDIGGDEGQGFEAVSYLQQQPSLTLASITSTPVRTACNTTLTQAVTASKAPQTVTVASTTGCNVNDWVVINEEAPTGVPNHQALQITAVGTGTISGVFTGNYTSPTPVTPALVLSVSGTYQFGQGRILVDLSGASYSAGTVASISGGQFTGSGTTWSTGMVGGTSPNTGCISLTADDYASAPFNGTGTSGKLKSWYQILAVTDATHLGIFKTSVAGDASYEGKGPGSGGYIIRPCAEVLVVTGNSVVLETSTATWTNGDNLELLITPYSDVSGHQEYFAAYTPGGAFRRAYSIVNTGSRTFNAGLEIRAVMPTGTDVDPVGWNQGVSIQNAATGIFMDTSVTGSAMSLPTKATANIAWGIDHVGYNIVDGSNSLLLFGGSTGGVETDRGALSVGVESNPPRNWLNFEGLLGLHSIATGNVSTRLRFYDSPSVGADPQTAADYMDLRYVDSSGRRDNQPKYWSNTSVIFSATNGSNPSGLDLFVLSGDTPGSLAVVGSPEVGTAVSGTNYASGIYRWESSIWNGSSAAARWMQAKVTPDTSTNGFMTWGIDAVSALCSYNIYYPIRAFQVNERGKLSFGVSDANGCGGITEAFATFDPTALTGDRTYTVPDHNGTMSVFTTVTKTANYTVLTGDAGTDFDNVGAAGVVVLTLPTAGAGVGPFCATVDAAQTLEFLAPAGAKIFSAASPPVNGAAAGNVQSNSPGSRVCLISHKALQWYPMSVTGSWIFS